MTLSLPAADLAAFTAALDLLDKDTQSERYQTQPAEWVADRLGGFCWSKQTEILESVRDNRFTAVKACHGPGKSKVASWAACWWMETHPPGSAKVISTAPTFSQVQAILWSEINEAAATAATLAADHPDDPRRKAFNGRINETEWKLGNRLMAFGRKPADHNLHAFQGHHATYVLIIIDEACGVIEQFWTAALALATGIHCRVLVLGNPDDPNSKFARVCDDEAWNVITISAYDTPAFTGEKVPEALLQVLVSQQYVEDVRREYGEASPIFLSKVLGTFPIDATDTVVRIGDLRACALESLTPRTADELAPVELGIDWAAGGPDATVIRERRGMRVGREWTSHSGDAMANVGLVLQAIRESGATAIKGDSNGVGHGPMARLRELHGEGAHPAVVIDVNVSVASSQPHRFPRLRSEIWWEIGRRLSEDRAWDFSGLDEKDRDRLISQLTAPKYRMDSSGRIVVELKEETKKRLGRSPDNADALLLAFHTPPGGYSADRDWLDSYRNAARQPRAQVGPFSPPAPLVPRLPHHR